MRHAHLLFTLVIFALLSLAITFHPLLGVFDSVAYWGALQIFLHGGDPYNFEELERQLAGILRQVPHSQRIGGHPWTLTFTIPFYLWPFPIAKFLLAFTNLSLYYLCIRRLESLWHPLPRFASLLMWGYIPFLATMFFGQFSIFLLLGTILLIEWLESTERPWWKWAIGMTLLAIKPQGFVVVAPLLAREFLRTSSAKDRRYAVGMFVLVTLLSSPLLTYLPEWFSSNRFSHQHRTATLSSYARDLGALLGYDSALWLWALPAISLGTLLALGVRVTNTPSLLLILTLSQVTAPYLWVYDACALMPLFYALIGAVQCMKEPGWRRHLGILFSSVAIFPIYLTFDSDFSFMRMHNVCMGIAAILLLPGLREYLRKHRGHLVG